MKNQSVIIDQIDGLAFIAALDWIKEKLNALESNLTAPASTKLLTREQVAQLLQVTTVTVWDWTNKGILKAYRIGNMVRYVEAEVLEVVVSKKTK